MENRGNPNGPMALEMHDEFVDPAEFLEEMTSRRQLWRSDENGATLRGLLDPATGQRILVEEERLLQALQHI